MTVNIIELNDSNIRISNADNILAQSPGFANIAQGSPSYGEEARKQSRLHPRQSFNQFWSQLSLDPLVNTNSHFRHQADVAFGHLNSLAETCELNSEAVFVIPSNYNRNQLAILLGLVKQLPFNATGLVDLSVVATSSAVNAPMAIYIDAQLHQCVLTRLVIRDGRLQRDAVLQIPGTGLLALHDGWAHMITDAFIKQSRFDPLHNAETEQYIYNQLPTWIAQARQDNEVLLEINHKGAIHQAKINRGHFEQKARNIFSRIKQELESLGASESEIFLPDALAELPGTSLYIPGATTINGDAIAGNCLACLEHIQGNPEALSFITSLPGRQISGKSAGNIPDSRHPSHILVNHKAFPLSASTLCIGSRSGHKPAGSEVFIEVDDPSMDGVITITRHDQGFFLDSSINGAVQVNGTAPNDGKPLSLGDRINITNSATYIQLIQVQ